MASGTATDAELAERLHQRGLRVTPQRTQVLSVVRSLGHATPEQISARTPGVDLTTVYRTLEVLEQIGLVSHAHLGHGAPSFRPSGDDHVHVVCHECGSVIDAPPDLVDALQRRLLDERGFELDRAHFTVFGLCAECRTSAGRAAGRHVHNDARHVHVEQSGAAAR